ncbi:hypothetical protein ACOME3_005819 [Neoechinorhynchus agilis]
MSDLTETERAGVRDRDATSHIIWRRNLDDQAKRLQKIRNERDEDAEMGSGVNSQGKLGIMKGIDDELFNNGKGLVSRKHRKSQDASELACKRCNGIRYALEGCYLLNIHEARLVNSL